MLNRLKNDGAVRLKEDKIIKERKKNVLVLIIRYLSDYGYTRSACSLEDEAGVSLKKWDACDNVDLYYILKDYEEYHQIKFGKPLKLVKKIAGDDNGPKLPMIPNKPPNTTEKQSNVAKDETKINQVKLNSKSSSKKLQENQSKKTQDQPLLLVVFLLYS